jgi:hypothetical protein
MLGSIMILETTYFRFCRLIFNGFLVFSLPIHELLKLIYLSVVHFPSVSGSDQFQLETMLSDTSGELHNEPP